METLQEHTITPQLDTPSTPGGRRRLSSLTVLGTAVAVIVVAALILSLFEWSSEHSKLATQSSLRASAVKAADAYAVDFGSYDYKNLHGPTAPWTVIEDHATPRFKTDYQKTSSALESTIVTYKATAKATVPLSAVSSISSSKAVVLLELDQTITNSTQKSGPQSQQFIVVMTLLRQKGQWAIDNVQASV
jgi:Mce-associated membrane protein